MLELHASRREHVRICTYEVCTRVLYIVPLQTHEFQILCRKEQTLYNVEAKHRMTAYDSITGDHSLLS